MEVILLERVEKLGGLGEVVEVKPGYARNYLLPQKKALRATKENRAFFEKQRVDLEGANQKHRELAEATAEASRDISIVLTRQAGDSGQLYGSVNARDIANGLHEIGLKVTRQQVWLNRVVKAIGLFPVRVALHPEVVIEVTINVARSPEEAEAQARGEILTGPEAIARAAFKNEPAPKEPTPEESTPEEEAKEPAAEGDADGDAAKEQAPQQ
jgi:large subunit ribosomal protein L9